MTVTTPASGAPSGCTEQGLDVILNPSYGLMNNATPAPSFL